MRGEIGSFSFDVAKRILNKLDEGDINRTNLATFTGLNYRALVRYLSMLTSVGWTSISDDGSITITPLGREIRKKLAQLQLGDPQVASTEYPVIHAAKEHGLAGGSMSRLAAQSLEQPRGESVQKTTKSKTGQMKNVLIVDDEPDVALTYDVFLKSTGRYNVRVFTEPSSALRDFISKIHYYDLVILDIRMPQINGLQMYQSMIIFNPGCKFLFVTSLDAVDELVSLLPNVDARGIIRKPIGKYNFIRTVDQLLVGN